MSNCQSESLSSTVSRTLDVVWKQYILFPHITFIAFKLNSTPMQQNQALKSLKLITHTGKLAPMISVLLVRVWPYELIFYELSQEIKNYNCNQAAIKNQYPVLPSLPVGFTIMCLSTCAISNYLFCCVNFMRKQAHHGVPQLGLDTLGWIKY